MADPTKYVRDYSFTGYQTTNPADPLPADQVDNELSSVENSIDEIVEALKDVRRSDGALVNGIVTLDSLATEVSDALGTGAADSAAAAAASADDAEASADAAALSETAAAGSASSAAASLAAMLAAPATFYGTSTSSVAISVGSKTFVTQTGKFFQTGAYVLAVDNAAPTTNFVHGQVVSYNADTLVVNVTNVGGSGTITDWTVMVSGTRGAQGIQGAAGAGTGDMLGANNLSDVVNAATARSNLGLTIGTNVQAYNASLASLAGNSDASGTLEKTGATTVGTYAVTAAGKALLDDADAAAQRTTLGATATGDALMTAASASAARTTLGASSIGGTIFTAADAAAVRTALSLTSAATTAIGTSAGNLVALDGSAKLPAVDGSQLTNIAATGYGAAIGTTAYWYDDFFYANSPAGGPNWTSGVSGTSAAVNAGMDFSPANLRKGAQGIVSLNTGTTSTGVCYIGTANTAQEGLDLATGATIDLTWRVNIPTVSTGTQRFTTRVGLINASAIGTPTTSEPNDGCYFRQVDNVNSGNWQCVTRASGTETVINTSVAGSTSDITLRLVVDSAGSSVTFYINGSSQGANTTNIPTSAFIGLAIAAGVVKSVGSTARGVWLDYVSYWTANRGA
jgi:hypothetical protein